MQPVNITCSTFPAIKPTVFFKHYALEKQQFPGTKKAGRLPGFYFFSAKSYRFPADNLL